MTYCADWKSQGGKKQVSEGSDELDVFPLFDSFQHIIQEGDPEENSLQELNSLQQMRALSFALINTFFTDVKPQPSGTNADSRRREMLGCSGGEPDSKPGLLAHWFLP